MVEQKKNKDRQLTLEENVFSSFFQFSLIVLCNKKVVKSAYASKFHS